MIRVTRYLTLVAFTVVATLTATLPANAMPLPPRDVGTGASVVHDGMSITQVVVVAVCSSLLTIAIVLATQWARAQRPPGLVPAA